MKTSVQISFQKDSRVSFIHQELENINRQLQSYWIWDCCISWKTCRSIRAIIRKICIETVFTNHDYEPYALQRDQEIKDFLKTKGISFKTYKDQVLFERNEIVKNDGTAYKVYTPYSKKWLEAFHHKGIQFFPSEEKLAHCFKTDQLPF